MYKGPFLTSWASEEFHAVSLRAVVGGEDLITVTPHLDDAVLRANPKPYFGYSDNTDLLNHLHRLGIVSYHGGSVLVHLGRSGALHPLTADSLRAALLTSGWYDLAPATEWGDEPHDWNDPASLPDEPVMSPGTGWSWQGPPWWSRPYLGWNLEVLHWLFAADRVAPVDQLAGSVFLMGTSEELPPATEIYRMLRNLGERGLLATFPAALVGRAKAWNFDRRFTPQEKAAYARKQRAAISRAFAEYAPAAVLVFDVGLRDLGNFASTETGQVRLHRCRGVR